MTRGNWQDSTRRGTTLPLVALLLVVLIAMAAFAADLGYLEVARSEAQNAADAGALAGMSKLAELLRKAPIKNGIAVQTADDLALARNEAKALAHPNRVAAQDPEIKDSDIEIGYMANPRDQSNNTLDTSGWPARPYNAVRVTVRRDQNHSGGAVKLFFASVLGVKQANVGASATSAFVMGAVTPRGNHDGYKGGLLPFVYQVDQWNALLAASGAGSVTAANGVPITLTDSYAVNPELTGHDAVSSGADGRLEVTIFPDGTTAGNFGTINFTTSKDSNSTCTLEELIQNGPNEADWPDITQIVTATPSNPVDINGDPGLSGGMQSAVDGIVGEPHMILLYSTVTGTGNNASYRIVGFAPVTIVRSNLDSEVKSVTIQPSVISLNSSLEDSKINFDISGTSQPNTLFIGTRGLVR